MPAPACPRSAGANQTTRAGLPRHRAKTERNILEDGRLDLPDAVLARRDLDDTPAKVARAAGVKLSIATDAHAGVHLDLMRFGVDQARRAWLTVDGVINTRDLQALRPRLQA
jgi:histidinol phosphatase-like PHP family hydrolase